MFHNYVSSPLGLPEKPISTYTKKTVGVYDALHSGAEKTNFQDVLDVIAGTGYSHYTPKKFLKFTKFGI